MIWTYHPGAPVNGIIIPDEDEQRHMRALRLESNDTVACFDGSGTLYTCTVEVLKKSTQLIVVSQETIAPRKPTLEIAIAPTKNMDRLEWFIEKAVEIGIDKISLIKCDHSERPIIKLDRLMRVAIAAAKQSRKAHLPEITELINYDEWLKNAAADVKSIAHCADDSSKILFQKAFTPHQNCIIAIGPEGDFSTREIELSKNAGFVAVSLGNARLRTETAGIAAVHTFEIIQQQAL